MNLQGKTAVITGAGSGMGKASAKLFASWGAQVVVNDFNEAAAVRTVEEIKQGRGEAVVSFGDVSRKETAEKAIQQALDSYGSIDILFNNAGVFLPGDGWLENIEEDTWKKTIDVNLNGVYYFIKAVLPHMKRQKHGSIINTSSMAGMIGTIGWDAYTAAKGGVIALSRALAVEYGSYGIRVNVLCPGVIRTPMVEKNLADPKEYREYLESTPLARIGEPEEVATVAAFLASDLSSFITGTVIPVDGGWTAK